MNEQERHNRAVMLRRVRTVWLEGVLEESLHGGEIIDLGFAYRPAALGNSGVPSWQQAPEYDYLLPVGTRIEDVFAAAGRVLLVLGEPGAGKTTMLLQLVSHLLAAAEADESCPMPAVFSLATYANGRPLAEWLVEQLANNYEVPRKLGERWIEAGAFVPLLDGLDEVDASHRPACAEAINTFRERHPGVALLVTARNRDYQALSTRLHMDKAIILQALTPEQIDAYLARRGGKLDGLRASLAADRTLRELAQSPLMLSIMTLAATRPPTDDGRQTADRRPLTAEGRPPTADRRPQVDDQQQTTNDQQPLSGGQLTRAHLFDVYVERMARYRGQDMRFAPSDTIAWLSWLARQLTREGKPTFFLEDMQPTWLPPDDRERLGRMMRLLTFALLAGASLLPAFLFLVFGRWGMAVVVVLAGLLAAAWPALTGRFLLRARLPFRRIETVESLDWSWPYGLLGLAVGALGGLAAGALLGWLDRWSATPWAALLAAAGGVVGAMEAGLRPGDLRLRMAPGQGISQSLRSGLSVLRWVIILAGVLFAITLTIVMLINNIDIVVDSLPWMLWLLLYLGLGYTLAFGFLAYLTHGRLRRVLYDRGHVAEDYIGFLNQTAERNLLRRVGGGYTFVHALLLQYFSDRQAAQESRPPSARRS